jgi:hypothetical protein
MPQRDAIFPENRHALYEAHGYSAAIRSGDLLFVSGQVGSRADGSPEPDLKRRSGWRSLNWKRRLRPEAAPLTTWST